MKIVGVGCGPGMLTVQAIFAISEARLVFGSARALELAHEFISPDAVVHEIEDYKSLHTLPPGAVVLSTGDPMLAGLGYLPGEVVPGISSLQVALARLHIPMADISVVTAHGRDHGAALLRVQEEVTRGKSVFLLADPGFDVWACAHSLSDLPGEVTITLCENLGYPDERLETGSCRDPPIPKTELFCLVIRPGKERGG
ncbi:MAG: cobalt-precorrin-7 (C(5))-methyltransferase [Methanolinea sp.]|nr:cobalt-precorrin-7 (C(5))-methyltransferase [Methanolinea sp.]